MEHTKGLEEYVKKRQYREALGLPAEPVETYEMLAQGEYNRNYVFTHPATGKKLVLRVNFASQMHLEDQIGYEYRALKLLEDSGRTPRPVYVDGSRRFLPYGILVMEYLPGRTLDYRTDCALAAECLADIHSVRVPEKNPLLSPGEPLRAILAECEEMVKVYMESPLGDEKKKKRIRRLLDLGWKRAGLLGPSKYQCCINTELNSTNFLINGAGEKNFLVDWEKPLYGDPAQDLGHFLAPTTTFWKTDVILTEEEIQGFISEYIRQADGRYPTDTIRERTGIYIPVTCLRGITWCAMAWVEYRRPDRELVNASTAEKLEAYLSDDFMSRVEDIYGVRTI